MKRAVLLALFGTALTAQTLAPELQSIANHISEDDLRGNLSFLASDALEGRSTPSRGQEIAAEFIAAQFRRARLEAPVNGGYFQEAEFGQFTPAASNTEITFENGSHKTALEASQFTLQAYHAVAIERAPLLVLKAGDEATAPVEGKAVLAPYSLRYDVRERLLARKPALLVILANAPLRPNSAPRLMDLDQAQTAVPVLMLDSEHGKQLTASHAEGETVTVHAAAPQVSKVHVRNVVGVLPGSDPVLKDQYVLVTAHYDHLPMKADGPDRIYNGANDDGSGTVSVIEIAQALAAMPVKPRRTVVFMTFFGEELGLLGSRYYGRHPLFPLSKTIAQINIEQVGRTNPKGGFEASGITFTGYDFTDLPAAFVNQSTGVKVYSTKDTDAYFARSDNQALADVGIPASTVSSAYTFADYHQVSDEWQKIEFDNMARVDRAIALGVVSIANRTEAPKWERDNPKTEHYWKAHDLLNAPGASR